MPLTNGQILHQRYQIQSLLGQGNMVYVYEATDMSLNRFCVVQENWDSSTPAQEQFQCQAPLFARLRHPNLPQVLDYWIDSNGQPYLVTEFVEGIDLRTMVRQRGALTEPQAIALALAVLDALEYLHTQTPPIIHRNVRPASILLASPGRVMLINLGTANVVVGGDTTLRGYAPLEQYSSGGMDARADLYALGATLYFALTTQAPPDAVDRAMGVDLVSPRAQNSSITPRVEQAILDAMRMASADRPQSAAEMRRTLTGDTPTRSTVSRSANAPMLGHVLRMELATTVGAQLVAGLATLVLILIAALITVCFVLYALDVLRRAVQVP